MKFRHRIPGICDRCGLRFRLKTLKEEDILGRLTGNRVCPKCYDKSHPQLDTRWIRTNDQQSVRNSRSDSPELEDARKLFGWKPVGGLSSGSNTVSVGQVEVTIS